MPSSTSSSSSSLNQFTFRRYHDALWGYHQATSIVTHRIALEQEERQLGAMPLDQTAAPLSLPSAPALAHQESGVDIDYCKALTQLACSQKDEIAREEGHLWSYLTVHKLGLAALLWHDDSTSLTQSASAQVFFLQQLSSKIQAMAKEFWILWSKNRPYTRPKHWRPSRCPPWPCNEIISWFDGFNLVWKRTQRRQRSFCRPQCLYHQPTLMIPPSQHWSPRRMPLSLRLSLKPV
jgi:hypothetical protein